MRSLVVTVLALVIGFVIGLMLSEVIGIVSVLGFGRAFGIKYLPVYTAIASAVIANMVDFLVLRKSRKV